VEDGHPGISFIGRRVHLSSRSAEVHPTRVQRVHRHGIPQHVDIAVLLRQAPGQCLPFLSAGPAPVHAQLPVGWVVLRIALDGNNIDGVRLMGVYFNGKPEVAG
jgi:hypothetical protein